MWKRLKEILVLRQQGKRFGENVLKTNNLFDVNPRWDRTDPMNKFLHSIDDDSIKINDSIQQNLYTLVVINQQSQFTTLKSFFCLSTISILSNFLLIMYFCHIRWWNSLVNEKLRNVRKVYIITAIKKTRLVKLLSW